MAEHVLLAWVTADADHAALAPCESQPSHLPAEHRSWETDDGEHRSKVEIVADEIGPSCSFATADVQRVERGAKAELSS